MITPEQFSMRSGRTFEHYMLGNVTAKNPEYVAKYNKLRASEPEISFDSALNLVRASQKENPFNPTRLFPKDLRNEILQQLKINLGTEDVGVYSAVRTPLDDRFGIDGFVELIHKADGSVLARVTLDTSLRNKGLGQYEADVLIPQLPEHIEHSEEYQVALRTVAGDIVQKIRKNYH